MHAYMSHKHHVCTSLAFMGQSAWVFSSPALKADETPGSLYTDLSKHCSKSIRGQSEFHNYVASSGFQEGKQDILFLFSSDHRGF